MSHTLKLKTPIMAHDEEIDTLTFRELTTEDIRRLGQPMSMSLEKGNSQKMDINFDVAAKYITRLTGIPETSVNKMSSSDFMNAAYMVVAFFGDATDGVAKQ